MIGIALTVAEGSGIIVVLLVLAFVALAYGLYTRRGSGISGHRSAGEGPENQEASLDQASEEIRNMGRGTAGRHGGPPREDG